MNHRFQLEREKKWFVMKYMYAISLLLLPLGLLLLFCGGMHTVWGIFQMVLYDSSKYFRDDVFRGDDNDNSTSSQNSTSSNATSSSSVGHQFWIVQEIRKWIYPHGFLLKLTIIMWYVGIMLGCFLAGWFLVRVVQKKNIYVSHYHIDIFGLV